MLAPSAIGPGAGSMRLRSPCRQDNAGIAHPCRIWRPAASGAAQVPPAGRGGYRPGVPVQAHATAAAGQGNHRFLGRHMGGSGNNGARRMACC
jgi:hypothetical protein